MLLHGCNSWEFDAFAFEAATKGRPLSAMAFYILQSADLLTWAAIDVSKLILLLHT
jgi:hypothetical protein